MQCYSQFGDVVFTLTRFFRPMQCYSQFGDVVFTLTRFFRDGAICGPTKLELTRSEDHGNVNRLETARPFDKLHLENLGSVCWWTCMQTMPMDSNCCNKFSSSTSEVEDISSQWGGILPANRSSLTPYKQKQSFMLKHSGDLFSNQKKLLIPGRKSTHQINREQDLTSNSLVDEETRGGLIASCSLRKPKLEPVLTQHIENSHEPSSIVREARLNTTSTINNLVKHEKLQVSDYGSFQNAEVGSAVLLGDEMIAQRKTEMLSQKNKVVLSSPSPCGDEERRGYAFLNQVKEKLTDAEYKEFLGFMKALKSKTMKIDQVLQCIVRLFSLPNRFPLLERFKDYIPAKYHSLYEQYLKRSDNAVDI